MKQSDTLALVGIGAWGLAAYGIQDNKKTANALLMDSVGFVPWIGAVFILNLLIEEFPPPIRSAAWVIVGVYITLASGDIFGELNKMLDTAGKMYAKGVLEIDPTKHHANVVDFYKRVDIDKIK